VLAQIYLNCALFQFNNANDSIQNIAAIAEEQAASSKEVATAIDNATKSTIETVSTIESIRKASNGTAEVAQSVAAQAEEMEKQSQNLNEILSHFKLPTTAKTAKTSKNIPALKSKSR
jgi:methyl-accepting chemotaxis protein